MERDQYTAVTAWLHARKGSIRVKDVVLDIGVVRTYNAAGEVIKAIENNYGQAIRLILDTPLGEESVVLYISDEQANRIAPPPPTERKRRYPRAPMRYPEPVDTMLNTCEHGIPFGEPCSGCEGSPPPRSEDEND